MNEYAQKKIKFGKALEQMFKEVQRGNKIYIVFSKFTFNLLVFTLAMSIIANLILAYLIVTSQVLVGTLAGGSTIIYIVFLAVLFLCIAAVISGVWLVFKGIDIVTDE